MNQEIKIIAPSKNAFQNTGALQNCFFRSWVNFKVAPSKNAFQKLPTPQKNIKKKDLTNEHKYEDIFTEIKNFHKILTNDH